MAITPITHDEFPPQRRKGGNALSSESQAVSILEVGTGIKFPCRWKHSDKTGQCAGMATLRQTSKRYGHTTKYSCKDRTLYVWRVA